MTHTPPPFVSLLLADEILPSDFSPFRTVEYGHYLRFFDSAVLSLEDWYTDVSNDSFADALAGLPLPDDLKQRIFPFRAAPDITAKLAYVTFLDNAARMLPYFEAKQLPFILQLYPGGAFELNQPNSDERLRAIKASGLCRKVVVTQTVTQRYLTDTMGFDPAQVEFIYGGVFDSRVEFDFFRDKIRYGSGKDTIDLCFVAHRYGNNMSSKGYDHFVAVAQELAASDPRIRFHVVGDYTPDDIPLGVAADRFTYYGRRPSVFFRTFYPRMDAIISVNRPFVLAPGAFDGFPTGACMEAGFRGVLNCINDPLDLNIAFTDGQDIILLDFEPAHTAARIRSLIETPDRLYDLAYANWRKFKDVFDVDRQLWARTKLIADELIRSEALIIPPPPPISGLDGMMDNNVAFWRYHVRSHEVALQDLQRRHDLLYHQYKDLDAAYAVILDARSENASLKETLAAAQGEIAFLNDQIASLNEQSAAQQADLTREIEQLRARIAELDAALIAAGAEQARLAEALRIEQSRWTPALRRRLGRLALRWAAR